MENNFSIIISTCDKFSDLWDAHVLLLNQNWADRNVETFLVTDKPTDRTFENVTVVAAGEGTEITERLRAVMPLIKTEYVLFTLDDYFLTERISTQAINEDIQIMRNTPKSVWTAKLRCSCGAGFIQFKWRVNRDGAVIHGFQCYRRTRRPSISYLQEHGLDLSISCQIKAISEWKLDLMAAKVFEHLTFDKGKTVKEVYKILSRCMAEEKTVRISRKAMLEKSIAKQRERLDKYIDLCADGIITKQELMERRKGLDNQIADLQSQYESVEQEDECSGALDMNLISQKLDEWQRASKNDVDRELINSCVAQITPLTNEEFRWVLDFQMSEVRARNAAAYTMDGFVEMARFSISFEEAKAFKASRNQGIRKNEWQDLTVVVGIWSKTQK